MKIIELNQNVKQSTGSKKSSSISEQGDFQSFLENVVNSKSTSSDNEILEAKAQATFKNDIKRLAKIMGIGPNMLMASLGDIKIDPNLLDFKVNSEADEKLRKISNYFGISPMTMSAIFDKLGLQKEELTDKKMMDIILLKLKGFFGLKDSEANDIKKILEKKENTID